MKKLGILITVLAIQHCLLAQDRTYEFESGNSTFLNKENREDVLVVSFDDKMYRSDVDRELGKHNQLNQAEIQHFFQTAMATILVEKFAAAFNVSSMSNQDEDSAKAFLSFIHNNIKYAYEPLPDDEKKAITDLKLKDKKAQKNNGISNGEVTVTATKKQGFMNAYIKNDTLLSYLNKNKKFDYLILLNELDLTYMVENPEMAAYGGIKKKIKTHYSIYNLNGDLILSGAEEGYLDNEERDINKIAATALPQIADKILLAFKEKTAKE